MIKINNLNIVFEKNIVLQNANFSANQGITCIIGHSGSGKSSILNAITDQISYKCDEFYFSDTNMFSINSIEKKSILRTQCTYIVQGNNFINDMNCYDNIRLFTQFSGNTIDDETIDEYLDIVGLNINKETMPNNLSGGEKQRLALAQALAKNVDVILCDEITASLDSSRKLEVMKLLRKIADDFHKTIIITSHDEEIFGFCDVIYEIENQTLVLKKESHTINIANKTDFPLNIKGIPSKYIRKYNLNKIERQFSMFMIYSIICAIAVSLSSFLIYYCVDTIKTNKEALLSRSNTELYVVNQSITIPEGVFSYAYHEDNQPFGEDIYHKLCEIEHIDQVYPFYSGSALGERIGLKGPVTKEIYLLSPDNNIKTITHEADSTSLFVFPYYEEQYFDEQFQVINKDKGDFGAYISTVMLNLLGHYDDEIEELEGCSIKMDIYLPVASEIIHGNVTIGEDEPIPTDLYVPKMEAAQIEIPVLGVIPSEYTEVIKAQNIYLPFEYMNKLHQELLNSYELKEGELPWNENTYVVFAENPEYLEDINLTIKQLDSQIATGSAYTNIKAYLDTMDYMLYTAVGSLIIILITGFILSYTYGNFYYQKNKEDVIYLNRNYFTKKEWHQLIIHDIFYQSLIIVLISLPLILVINYLASKLLVFRAIFSMFSIEYFFLTAAVILLTVLNISLSRLQYYKKAIIK